MSDEDELKEEEEEVSLLSQIQIPIQRQIRSVPHRSHPVPTVRFVAVDIVVFGQVATLQPVSTIKSHQIIDASDPDPLNIIQ